MITGWLIYRRNEAEHNSSYIEWFQKEAMNQGIQLKLILREDMTIGIIENEQCVYFNEESVQLPDFAIVRTIEPLLNLHLETIGIQVFNSSQISRICNNKALSHHHVNQIGLPMVDTIYSDIALVQVYPPLSYPFIIKDVTGRGGKQVFYIHNQTEWMNCRQKFQLNSEIIFQTADVQLGKDLRVFVVGKEIVAAVLRESKTDFRSNFTLGGSARLYPLQNSEIKLIQKIVDHFEFGMVGIDFLIAHDGSLLFNEIEDVVGSRTLSKYSDINILEKYIAHIRTKV